MCKRYTFIPVLGTMRLPHGRSGRKRVGDDKKKGERENRGMRQRYRDNETRKDQSYEKHGSSPAHGYGWPFKQPCVASGKQSARTCHATNTAKRVRSKNERADGEVEVIVCHE